MTNSNIVMIQAEQLEHHPDNPRKEIGDITELAASIGVDGILQNLTVVPQPKNKDKFYIVIGNRRYEAGRAAGLHEFPCVISDMDYTKQLETMLVENMNRSDLTPYEEAKGFEQLTLEEENSIVNSRCEHYQTYSRKLCSRLDETQKENNELFSQNALLENENNSLKKENKQLKFYIKMLEIDTKKKQKGISVCPICGYKVKQDDKSDNSKSI